MKLLAPRLVAAMAASVAALCGLAAPAGAQYPRYGDPYNTLLVASPSSYWGYTYNPYASMLHGVADVTRANGDYFIKTQQAAQLREQVRQAKLVTRRLQLEQWAWERDFRAEVLQRQRERERKFYLEKARTDPPRAEIYAAIPHNRIFDALRQRPDYPREGSVKVEAEWLSHIHASVLGHENMGLLKDDRILWPQLLTRADFAPTCEKIEKLFADAKQQARNPQSHPRIDPKLLTDLRRLVAECSKQLDREWTSPNVDLAWNDGHLIAANRFLRDVKATVYALERSDPAMLLNPLRGATVAELVAHMKKQGIRFAPATDGCERYYIALHGAMADELTRLQQAELSGQRP